MSISLKIIISASLFVLTLTGGIWLGRLGKPLNERLFNIHKFSALAAAMFIAVVMHNLYAAGRAGALMPALNVVAGICVVVLFVSGALLSLDKPVNVIALNVHRLASIAALIILILVSCRLSGIR